MWKYIAVILLLLLYGCRATEKQPDIPPSAVAALVGDILGVMLDAYPPARTRLSLQSGASGAFETALLEALRLNGYAVAGPDKMGGNRESEPPAGLDLAYFLDSENTGGEARLSLHVGTESLSRLYAIQETEGGTVLAPQSAWSRRR